MYTSFVCVNSDEKISLRKRCAGTTDDDAPRDDDATRADIEHREGRDGVATGGDCGDFAHSRSARGDGNDGGGTDGWFGV